MEYGGPLVEHGSSRMARWLRARRVRIAFWIAVGEGIWGNNPLGWRFSAAIVGSLSILLIARIARRMFRSTLLGCIAAVLLSLER